MEEAFEDRRNEDMFKTEYVDEAAEGDSIDILKTGLKICDIDRTDSAKHVEFLKQQT